VVEIKKKVDDFRGCQELRKAEGKAEPAAGPVLERQLEFTNTP
jgi:hypothetical protein